MAHIPLHAQKKITIPQKVVVQDDFPRYLTIEDIQHNYLPISKKKIRKIVNDHIHTIRVGNKILVDRKHLEKFLENPPMLHI